MAHELEHTVESIFMSDVGHYYHYNISNISNNVCKFMEIPIAGETVEVPLFALETLVHVIMERPSASAIVTRFHIVNITPTYKTVNRYMQDVLTYDFYSDPRLYNLKIIEGGTTIQYYGTHGCVLDKDFNPLLMCSWRVKIEDNKLHLLRPILRINPGCFIRKADAMEKFIANKMTLASIQCSDIELPSCWYNVEIVSHPHQKIKIEIDESPFTITEVSQPSVLTTNEELLQVVHNHIEEVIQ